jgi:hypothetical protein
MELSYIININGGKMINFTEWTWVIDKKEMTCRNKENEVVVKMRKDAKKISGQLLDMPVALFAEIAGYENGEKIIEKIVKKAQEEYFRICAGEE